MSRLNAIFVCWLFALQASFVSNIKLLNVRIANHTILGSNTKLECTYDLEGENLYSIKWYKDGDEFFRYLPKSKPEIQIFEKQGIFVDIDKSNANVVVLKSLKLSSSGTYRCEVSAEAPSFQTVFQDKDLITVEEGPRISGLQPEYKVGETLNANCTSSKMKFHAHLIWYINRQEANSMAVYGPYFKIHYSGSEQLVTTVLGLSFKVTESHYKSGHIYLKCAAQLASVYLHSNEQVIKFTKLPTESIQYKYNTVQLANKIQDNSISMQNTPNIIHLTCVLLFCLRNNINTPVSH